ncbi:lysozyme 2-like [Schistocerca gregaria]|uniref:lysozyme 2-like n=1 Tax=Schistocerca gregaria TaxID=7010 RepID=UPI00211F251A|nr:lysozyme 2-like [Schistocerca gregaria]
MSALLKLLVVAAAASASVACLSATLYAGSVFLPEADDACLGCLCEATSGCNMSAMCLPQRTLCGPFLVAPQYWRDAGSPLLRGDWPTNPGAYYRCVTDIFCAAATVRGYLSRYAQDCNWDGRVDCDDYARIHYMGGHQCTLPVEHLGYYKVFRECMDSLQQLNG